MSLFYGLLTKKCTAIPIFLIIMSVVFMLTFYSIGAFLHRAFTYLMVFFTDSLESFIKGLEVNPIFTSLVIDGICTGVGSVLSFLPTIAVMFTCLFFLRESGYTPLASWAMGGVLKRLGLPGESVLPLLLGFGCSVPAIMAAGTIRGRKSRHMTILLIPFMSCSAKIPIYSIFVATFFTSHRILAIICIYLCGILIAAGYSLILKKTLFPFSIPNSSPLPGPCRLPSLAKVFNEVKICLIEFIRKTFTVILLASVLAWFLQSFDTDLHMVSSPENSILAFCGRLSSPLLAPLGFGDWRIAAAIIAGLMAKEAVISTLAIIAGGLPAATIGCLLPEIFSPVTAFTFMLFCLLYIPCIATMVIMKKETGSSLFVIGAAALQLALAWILCFIIFNLFGYCVP